MSEPREPTIADLARSMDKLVGRFERREDCPFTEEEIEQIKRGAALVEWFDTAGWIGKRFLAFVGGLVLLISQWERIEQWLEQFFGGAQ